MSSENHTIDGSKKVNRSNRHPAFFPYPGSKARLMPTITKLLPYHEHYVSVFGGSATDILLKPRSHVETFNDLDGQISNLFSVVVDGRTEELKERIAGTPARCQKVFEDARGVLADEICDPVRSAWAFLVCAHQGFCKSHAQLLRESEWGYFRYSRAFFRGWERLPATIDIVRRRFHRVQICSWDWKRVVEKMDSPETVFFCDPPYHPDLIKEPLYRVNMTAQEHVELLSALRRVQGYVVLCGYHHELYDSMLADWHVKEISTKTNINLQKKCLPRTEVLWMNYTRDGKKLVDVSR